MPAGRRRRTGSRINRALDDPSATQEVGRKASAIVDEHFALERVLDRHLEVFGDMIADADQSRSRRR